MLGIAVLLAGLNLGDCCMASLPILTYHDLTTDPTAVNSMVVTVDRFRSDMEFLQQEGYTPLLPADLIAIRTGQQARPAKPVMITFDDGYRSNYTYAYPILRETGMKATIAVVAANIHTAEELAQAGRSERPEQSMLIWEELREMAESGIIEIGSHTYNLHNPETGGLYASTGSNGITPLRGESETAYRIRVGYDLKHSMELIRQYTGQETVRYFAFPFGASDPWADDLLDDLGLSVSVLVTPRIAFPAFGLDKLPRFGVQMEQSAIDWLSGLTWLG